jgi:uncharacterized protein
MRIENHNLHHEFPEYGERIHNLKITDAHFAKLFDEYDRLDHQVRRIEEKGSLIADAELETLKMRRIHLKDNLYSLMVSGNRN